MLRGFCFGGRTPHSRNDASFRPGERPPTRCLAAVAIPSERLSQDGQYHSEGALRLGLDSALDKLRD